MLTFNCMSFELIYYNRRVEAEIKGWPDDIFAEYTRMAETLMKSGPAEICMPDSRLLGNGLFELRPRGSEGIGRALYCYKKGKKVIVLHAFIKKSEKAPNKDLRLARKRLKEVK